MFPASGQQVIALSKCPCCLDVLQDDTVIVGTYEFETGGDHRKGSLSLVKSRQLLLEQECSDGGVFDLQVIRDRDSDTSHVLVAHANGCVTLYSISLSPNPEITVVTRQDTGSSLLTSLNSVPCESSTHWLCVGTSTGQIKVLKLHAMSQIELCTSIEENIINQPVWCIRLLCFGDDLLIFSGSDDCTWKIFSYQTHSKNVTLLYTNKDAGAGVTSIMLQVRQEASHLIGSLVVGSYDEYLRYYSFSMDADARIAIAKQSDHRIPGSGVWRIRTVKLGEKTNFLIAGMYSGIHVLDLVTKELVSKDWQSVSTLEASEEKQLIYDVVLTKNGDFVVASFYQKCLYILSNE